MEADAELTWGGVLRAALVCGLGFLWAAAFWFAPARDWPLYRELYSLSNGALEHVPIAPPFRWVLKSWLFVLAPIGLLWLAGHPPRSLGLTRVAPKGWRIVGLGFVLALPVLVWVGAQDEIHRYYAHMFRARGWMNALANALVIVSEHVLIEGVLLALALPSAGLHAIDEPARAGRLAWLGFGLPEGKRGFLAWLGVPAGAWPALICQGLVFGLMHAGKADAELFTAFPGGVALGFLTYRVRAVWPSVVLHLGTGAVIIGTVWLLR